MAALARSRPGGSGLTAWGPAVELPRRRGGLAALPPVGSGAVAWRPSARPKAAAMARARPRAPALRYQALRERALLVAPATTLRRAEPEAPWLPQATWSAS